MKTWTKVALGAAGLWAVHQVGVATGFFYMENALNTKPEERNAMQKRLVDGMDKKYMITL